jgi:hypothetical protein
MIGRIEYTSCDDGIEGISGFQIRAATPNLPAALLTTAIRDSVYEPPPTAPSVPSDAELARFPVALGYSPSAEGLVIYRASYSGRDHSGRWGNYFAQALVIDPSEHLPGLPIDMWQSAIWRTASTRVGRLEPAGADELVPDDAVGPDATRRFLATTNRSAALPGLLAAVRAVLDGQHGRLVLVAEDSASAALWVSAITRSFPAALVWGLSFTTYTCRPESHQALLTFTTPDVGVPAYGNYRTIDLRRLDGITDAPTGDYERIVTELWAREDPGRLVAGIPVDPPLSPAELDQFARCALLFETLPVSMAWDEPSVLDGLEFALRRSPTALAQPWDRVASAVREVGDLRDVVRWSRLLHAASVRQAPIPRPLMQHYVRAAVQAVVAGPADASIWIPSLNSAAQADLASTVFAPALWTDPSPELSQWLLQPDYAGIRDATLNDLAGRVRTTAQFETAVDSLTPQAATAIAALSADRPRLRLAAGITLARSQVLDPVEVLLTTSTSALTSPAEWPALVRLLWPSAPPSLAQAEALLTGLSTDALRATGLADDHFVQRLLDDSAIGLTVGDYALAGLLAEATRRDGALLSEPNRRVIDLVSRVGFLMDKPPYDAAYESAVYGMGQCRGFVARPLADSFYSALASWLIGLDWENHCRALPGLMIPRDEVGSRLFKRYAERVEAELSEAKPERIAELITVWRLLNRGSGVEPDDTSDDQTALSRDLLEGVLPRGLKRASRRTLERVAQSPLASRLAAWPEKSFQSWWSGWQRRHERQGIMARLRSATLDQGD